MHNRTILEQMLSASGRHRVMPGSAASFVPSAEWTTKRVGAEGPRDGETYRGVKRNARRGRRMLELIAKRSRA